jgi:hypothetical protein
LPKRRSRVWYFAESPDHAVAEVLQSLRGQHLVDASLIRAGLRISLVRAQLAEPVADCIVDLCEPTNLVRLGIAPDALASRRRGITQPVAAAVFDSGFSGLRWWSKFWGDWHSVVLFADRLLQRPTFDEPEPLTLDSQPVRDALKLFAISAAS